MKYLEEFRNPQAARRIIDEIASMISRRWVIMEICGGQTHAIIRNGIDQLLPDQIELIHGPGCPVCVTPLGVIDKALEIAARPDVIREDNVERLKAKLVVQGANIPVTAGAEAALHARGVLSIPDFIANAGGVICGAVEYRGGTQDEAFRVIEEKIRANTQQVLEEAGMSGQEPRAAAVALAERRVRKAMSYGRWG